MLYQHRIPMLFRHIIQTPVRNFKVATGVCGYAKDSFQKIGFHVLGPDETTQNFGSLGEDAFFMNKTDSQIDSYGVADGVGGWRSKGIDPR